MTVDFCINKSGVNGTLSCSLEGRGVRANGTHFSGKMKRTFVVMNRTDLDK